MSPEEAALPRSEAAPLARRAGLSPLALYAGLALLCQVPLLLLRTTIWDDLTVYDLPKDALHDAFVRLGAGFLAWFFEAASGLDPSWRFLVALVSILAHAAAGECARRLLAPRTGQGFAFLAGFLVALAPLDIGRPLLILLLYALALPAFWGAALAFDAGLRRGGWGGGWGGALLATALLCYAFVIQSFLVMWLAVLGLLAAERLWAEQFGVPRAGQGRRWIAPLAAMAALPFVWFVLKRVFFPIQVAGYNAIDFSARTVLRSYAISFRRLMIDAPWLVNGRVALFLVALGLAGALAWLALRGLARGPGRRALLALGLSCAALVLAGLLPYAVVDKWAAWIDWDTRNQLAMLVPAAVLAACLVGLLPAAWRRLAGAALAGVFAAAQLTAAVNFLEDSHLQSAMVEAGAGPLRGSKNVVLEDGAADRRYLGRRFRNYELARLWQMADGADNRVVVQRLPGQTLERTVQSLLSEGCSPNPTPLLWGHPAWRPTDGLTVARFAWAGPTPMPLATVLRLSWLAWTDPAAYRAAVVADARFTVERTPWRIAC